MSQEEFDLNLRKLSPTEERVLKLMVSGKSDQEMAQALELEPVTVRKNIQNICDKLDIEKQSSTKRSWRRHQLIALVAQYKSELLGNGIPTVVNEDEPASAITPEPALTNEPAEFDLNFVGRNPAIAELNNRVSQGAKVIVIQAAGGVGKTTLAQEYLKTQGFELVIELPMAKEKENITAVESVIEEWLKQDFQEEPGREFGITLGRLKRQLQTRRVGILIDNLEPALDQQGKFIEPHRRYVELLRVLADSTVQSVTLITSRERLCESGVTVEHYRLPGLDESAWHQFFSKRNINIDASTLKAMHNAYGGNAKAMRIFCGAIREDFDGDMAAYWQENGADLLVKGDLKDLITSQFKRLQEICPKAYKLLCRLGCFRYQDVPVVSTEGILCLLWDVPEAQRRRIIESLRNRSLVECRKGEYWLHPVIRAEAISRLRESEDWETANRTAAEYWTEIIKTVETIKDALTAFESYYHYVDIHDYEKAASLFIKKRKTKWKILANLYSDFWRLGLFQQTIISINRIIKNVKNIYYLTTLNLAIGYTYNLMGYPLTAIDYHISSANLAEQYLNSDESYEKTYELKAACNRLYASSFVNLGCCKIDLWKIEEAIKHFEDSCQYSENTETHRYAVDSWYCLAYLYSCLGIQHKAYEFAEKACSQLAIVEENSWSQGYALLFLGLTYSNLEELKKSFEMYRKAIDYAEQSYYTQVKAKALYGLAELYRKQGKFNTALSHHSEAIELLDKIGAKCDLAEAYYQLALTYQRMAEAENSEVNFQEAIRLYTEMEAPKQVEKVLQAMANK